MVENNVMNCYQMRKTPQNCGLDLSFCPGTMPPGAPIHYTTLSFGIFSPLKMLYATCRNHNRTCFYRWKESEPFWHYPSDD